MGHQGDMVSGRWGVMAPGYQVSKCQGAWGAGCWAARVLGAGCQGTRGLGCHGVGVLGCRVLRSHVTLAPIAPAPLSPVPLSLVPTSAIQSSKAETRVKTVGFLGVSQPSDETKLAMPCTSHCPSAPWQFRGPPESPWGTAWGGG